MTSVNIIKYLAVFSLRNINLKNIRYKFSDHNILINNDI